MAEIQKEDANYLLNVNFSDYCNHIVEEHALEPIILEENEITVDQQEIHSTHAAGTKVTFFVPFRGAWDLFLYRTSTYTPNPPRGLVKNQVLELSFDDFSGSSDQIKKQFDRDFAEIKRWLGWSSNEVKNFNDGLIALVEGQTKIRREKLLRDQGLVSQLGFPIKQRENAPTTYAVAEIKRKINANPKPLASTDSIQPRTSITYSRI